MKDEGLIDALANPGDTIMGLLRLTYDGFDADPLAEVANQILFGVTVDSAVAVTTRKASSRRCGFSAPSGSRQVGLMRGSESCGPLARVRGRTSR